MTNTFRGKISENIIIDTSENKRSYLYRGENGECIRLSSSAYLLLKLVEEGLSFEEISIKITGTRSQTVSSQDVENAYLTVIERITKIEENYQGTNRFSWKDGFWFGFTIIPKHLVSLTAEKLRCFFNPFIALFIIIFVIVSCITFSRYINIILSSYYYRDFWLGYCLFIISLLFHELGHASACSSFNIKPNDIGFAVYWMYPVFFCDVNSAWMLKRWQRVIVDVGGIYFQLMMSTIYIVIYIYTAWLPFGVAVIMVGYSCLLSLNPFLKFDGYWVVADALGVTNLGKQVPKILRHIFKTRHNIDDQVFPWSKLITWLVIVYSVSTFIFWVFFMYGLLPSIVYNITRMPNRVHAIYQNLTMPDLTALPGNIAEFAISSFLLFFSLTIIWRAINSLRYWVLEARQS